MKEYVLSTGAPPLRTPSPWMVLGLITLMLVAGCGSKGPLYRPGEGEAGADNTSTQPGKAA